jgi:hypothetical protein
MISMAMSPAQYAAARAAITDPKNTEVTGHSESGEYSGNFRTAQVAFSYSYDGTWLHLNITAKYGVARLASEATIQGRLQALLARLSA